MPCRRSRSLRRLVRRHDRNDDIGVADRCLGGVTGGNPGIGHSRRHYFGHRNVLTLQLYVEGAKGQAADRALPEAFGNGQSGFAKSDEGYNHSFAPVPI